MNYKDFIDGEYEHDNDDVVIEFLNDSVDGAIDPSILLSSGSNEDMDMDIDVNIDMNIDIDDRDKNAYVNMFLYYYNDFINVFLCYYKKIFNKKSNITGFDGIDFSKDNSTNKWMELFMEHIQKYKNATGDLATIYPISTTEINIDDCEELYLLDIENRDKKICKLLVPLMKYLADNDWTNVRWDIIPLK